MPKPLFNPRQYELRNELPVFVSETQQAQIDEKTTRVNQQLDWVAQILGWNGDNYWNALTDTVAQKRAMLGGTFGVYNAYTILPLQQIKTIEVPLPEKPLGSYEPQSQPAAVFKQVLITDVKPNITEGLRVIIGDQQTFIYSLEGSTDEYLVVDIGTISPEILNLIQSGALIKVDAPANRPFPFTRAKPEASADAYFRCLTGSVVRQTNYIQYLELVLSPYDQSNILNPYRNLDLIAGSYCYFDREVYMTKDPKTLIPWVLPEWIESKGLWKLYIHPEFTGNQVGLVWNYPRDAYDGRAQIAYTFAQVVEWNDPSDWGNHGNDFNPVLDRYLISKSYNIAGLNYSMGTNLWLGDEAPQVNNPLWYDAGKNVLYALDAQNQWSPVGSAIGYVALQGQSAPPPANYDKLPGTIWQSADGRVYIWDPLPPQREFAFYYADYFEGSIAYYNPEKQLPNGLYLYEPDGFYVFQWNYQSPEGLYVYNTVLDDEGFYTIFPGVTTPSWFEIIFNNSNQFTSVFTPAYASNLYLLADGKEIPPIYITDSYQIEWDIVGEFLYVEYKALSPEGESFIPSITVATQNGSTVDYIDISNDFKARPEQVTSIPYNEVGILNNFRGTWGNKGGARSMDFAFDALDIHGFNERQALWLEPVRRPISFDFLLKLVSGCQIYTGNLPPATAEIGDYYWNDETGALAVYFLDRDRVKSWVEVDYETAPEPFFILRPLLSSGTCVLENGDTWKDPVTEAAAVYYESPNGQEAWIQLNWDLSFQAPDEYEFTQPPDPEPRYDLLEIFVEDTLVPEGQIYENDDFTFYYEIDRDSCQYIFYYTPLTPQGVRELPQVFVNLKTSFFRQSNISQFVFSDLNYYMAPCVQNAESTLRPWKTQSLEVTDEKQILENTYFNGLRADTNLGPGDENWDRSFVRLPAEYGRDGRKWNQAELVMQDMAYFGSAPALQAMKCPAINTRPQIYDEVIFYHQNPDTGALMFSAPFLYSAVDGFDNLAYYFSQVVTPTDGFYDADFDFVTDFVYDSWDEAELTEYDPLHLRQTVDVNDKLIVGQVQTEDDLPNFGVPFDGAYYIISTGKVVVFREGHWLEAGDWDGIYVETTGTGALSGYLPKDLAGKTIIPMPQPNWDASIYKFAPLCPLGEISYVEDPNNFKVGYAYFTADLSASEDGFFDQTQDVAWREPLEKDQTLYILNN